MNAIILMCSCSIELCSWRVIRVQKSFGTKELNRPCDEAAPSPSSSLSAPKKRQEDLWTFDSGEEDDDDIDLEELGRAFSEAATISPNTKKQTCEHETSLKPSSIVHRTQLADNIPGILHIFGKETFGVLVVQIGFFYTFPTFREVL